MLKVVVRAIAIVAAVVVVLYAVLLAALYFGRNKLLFPGSGIVAQPVVPVATFPNAEDVKIPVDGATFAHAWWIPAQSGTAKTLLWFHGNGYPLEAEMREEAPALYQTRANLLLVDYRGYGASSPIKTTAETTAADARAAFRYLTEQKHIAHSDIWIAGRSIGAAVAVRLAAETPNAGGLVLITPISNTADVEPYRRLIKPLKWFGLTKEFDSLARMPHIHIPVTIIAGSLDSLAPPWMAQALFDAANYPKSIKIIQGAGHNDIFTLATPKINLEIEHAMKLPEPARDQCATTAQMSVYSDASFIEKAGDVVGEELAIQKSDGTSIAGLLLVYQGEPNKIGFPMAGRLLDRSLSAEGDWNPNYTDYPSGEETTGTQRVTVSGTLDPFQFRGTLTFAGSATSKVTLKRVKQIWLCGK